MKDFYTDETFTYVVDTCNSSSGDNASCDIPMLALLPNDVEYFICCPLFFNATSVLLDTPTSSAVLIEAKDFVETGYSTHNDSSFKAIMPPIFASELAEHRKGIANNLTNMVYMVRNFNNKTIRFTLRNCEGFNQDTVALGGYKKRWTLHLSLTPIRSSPCKYIISNKYKSFTYSITSVNAEGSANDCYITLPSINDNFNSYFVDVVDIKINTGTLATGQYRYINLYSYGFAENGYGGYQSQTDRMIIASPYIKNTSEPCLFAGNGPVFKISNMKYNRRVRFKMYYPFTGEEVLGADVDNGATTYYHITCIITPID